MCENKMDLMGILSRFIAPDEEKMDEGDGEKNNCLAFSPSQYKMQLSMSTEKRLETLELSRHKSSTKQCIFEAVPSIVIFQQFTGGNNYHATLTVKNVSKASHFIRLVSEPDLIFQVNPKGSTFNTKLAPGTSNMYTVKFSPEGRKDYQYRLTVLTDSETFLIPVVGPRPILDFPDEIIMPETGVKIPSLKVIQVRNVGDAPAVFTLSSSNGYFSIEPTRGIIEIGVSTSFTINFFPSQAGNSSGFILLKYETGEVVKVKVYGFSRNCQITLDPDELRISDTFLGMSNAKSFKISNNSNFSVEYQWNKYQDVETDEKHREKFSKMFVAVESLETKRYVALEYLDICHSKAHSQICQRILTDELSSLTTENFLFSDTQFILNPQSGKIGPHSFTEVNVIFQPREIGRASVTAYLEVSGQEARIPVEFNGECKGPVLKLNTSTIDVEKVYLCSILNLEVICGNEGLIPGTLVYIPKPTDFGGSIEITPLHQEISPNGFKSFNLAFSSSKNGEFIERVDFMIKESSEKLSIYLKGLVKSPTLYFNKTHLDLGTTAVGFTSKHEVSLENRSPVSVTFKVSIPEDGDEVPIAYEKIDNLSTMSSTSMPLNPREFSIRPFQATLDKHSSIKLEINFTPNVPRVGKTNLKTEIQGSDSIPFILPITFESDIALFEIRPRQMNIRFCFINFPYTLTFKITNASDVEGVCYFLRKPADDETKIIHSLSRNQWHLKPGQSKMASITVITRVIGCHELELSLMTFGKETPEYFRITCYGQGPIVTILPTRLDWGNTTLLQEKSMPLNIINDSPIPANFKAIIGNKSTPWTISPKLGEIKPLQSLEVIVTMYLRDAGKISDNILFAVANATTLFISLNAVGSGSPILLEPNIFPNIDMGLLLTRCESTLAITIANEGNKWQRLSFSNRMELTNTRSPGLHPAVSEIFSIEPSSMEIPARSKKEVILIARSKMVGSVSEDWWLYSVVEGQGKKELIGMSTIDATFDEPCISFNKLELDFFVNRGIDNGEDFQKIKEELYLSNDSGFNLNVHLSVGLPFKIIMDNDEQTQTANVTINVNEKKLINIHFACNEEKLAFRSKTFLGTLKLEYEKHPKVESIKCKATVNFPNILPILQPLRFDVRVGQSEEQNFILQNSGPIPVSFFLSEEETSKDLTSLKNFPSEATLNGSRQSAENIDFQESIDASANPFFEIYPSEGTIPPHSSLSVSCIFRARKPIHLDTQLICNITGGPCEYIKIEARSDYFEYALSESQIIFGQQLILGYYRKSVRFENRCEMKLTYQVEISPEDIHSSIEVSPNFGTIEPLASENFEVIYRPTAPGYSVKYFEMVFRNISVVKVTVEGEGIFPQVHIDLPHIWTLKNHSADVEYLAIQSMLNYREPSEEESPLLPIENSLKLMDKEWDLISDRYLLPSVMEIDMSIEKYMAKEYMRDIKLYLMTCPDSISFNNKPIPYLISAEYILDMGLAIIGEATDKSILLCNHAACKVSIRMKKSEKKNYLSRYGISVKLKDPLSLLAGESCMLNIAIQPTPEVSSELNKQIKRKIYLEVANGYTIPLTITAIITSPSLTPNKDVLDFGDVVVGFCKKMTFQVYNEGLVDCHWRIPPFTRQNGFSLFAFSPVQGVCSPDKSDIINVDFKPRKMATINSELIIDIQQGLAPRSIVLKARGIEPKLKISEPCINFPCGVPYVTAEEQIFLVKNIGQIPVEFSWSHLDEFSIEEDRIVRVLCHYYSTDEIFLPPRKVGCDLLPESIHDFYGLLIQKMLDSLNTGSRELTEKNIDGTEVVVSMREKTLQSKKGKSQGSEKKKSIESSTLGLEHVEKPLKKPMIHFSYNPEETENLLHDYIDQLQQDPDFLIKMGDPLGEILKDDDDKRKEDDNSREAEDQLTKKLCIIFHGAPFTQYQESACQTARRLNIPLVNIDNCFTKSIALGESSSSTTLRNLVDSKYEEFFKLAAEFIDSNSHIEEPGPSGAEYPEQNINFTLPQPSDPFKDFLKIPSIEELDAMDSLSRYEFKIEGICLLEQILKISGKMDGLKNSKKETFLDVDISFLTLILQEELLYTHFYNRFVIQTLKNNFMTNESTTLSKILQILTPMESIVIVTFHNSSEIYEYQVEQMRIQMAREEKEKLEEKLKFIDEMSASEFQSLPEEDKNLFFEKVHRPRIEEARLRREKFRERLSKLMTTETVIIQSNDSDVGAQLLGEPSVATKSKKIKKDSIMSSINVRAKVEVTKKSNAKSGNLSKGFDNVTGAMKEYESSLASIKLVTEPYENNGIFVWHVRLSNPWDLQLYEFLVDQIVNNISNSGIFQNNYSTRIPEPQLYSLVSLTKNSMRKTSIDQHPFQLFELSLDSGDHQVPEPRVILDTGEVRKFKIMFQPTKVGTFIDEFYIKIIGSNSQIRKIVINGSADVPHLELGPTSLFPKVKSSKSDETNGPTFFVDNNVFDFGALFVAEKDKQVHRKISTINFLNPSLIVVDAEFSIKNSNSNVFNLDPVKLSIKQKDIGVLTISAAAMKLGENTDNLFVTVRNNPRVHVIPLRTLGCKIDINLIEKDVAFGRVLQFRDYRKYVTMKNKSPIPIFWKIRKPELMNQQITFSPKSGWVRPLSESHVGICYHAQTVGPIGVLIPIEIFLHETGNDVLLSDVIKVSGETYDININVLPINLGTVKVGIKTSGTFALTNLGKYDLAFSIERQRLISRKISEQCQKNIDDELEMKPESGLLLPNKTISVNIHFTPKMEMDLKEISLLKCDLFEPDKIDTIVAEIPLTLSMLARYPRFKIQPHPELMFGPITINTDKNLFFSIENTGLFPISYKIAATQQLKNFGDSEKVPKLNKASHQLKIGPFSITKTEGTLDIGEVEDLSVECHPETEGQFMEKVFILIPDASPEDVNGKLLELSVESCVPRLDLNDLDFIFDDCYIVNSRDEFLCSSDQPYSIFSKSDMCLYFENVIVSTSHTVNLRIRNSSLVSAEVIIGMVPDSWLPSDKPPAFIIDRAKKVIPSIDTQTCTLTFTPSLIERYSCQVEAFVVIPSEFSSEKLCVKVVGNSCIPEIALIEPPISCKRGHTLLEFGRCLLGDTCTKIVSFRNVGKVEAKVTIEIHGNLDSVYSLEDVSGDRESAISDTSPRNFSEVLSHPGDVMKLMVLFKPKVEGKNEAQIRLTVVNNPYECLMIDLHGEGFEELIVLEGIPFDSESSLKKMSRESIKSIKSKRHSKPKSHLTYRLDMGSCFVSRSETFCFKIINKCANKYFRFEWNANTSDINFSPSIGHLRNFEHKDITVTFFTSEPLIHTRTVLNCEIREIHPVESPRGISWDNRCSSINWGTLENDHVGNQVVMTRIDHIGDEPHHHEIADEVIRFIQIFFYAEAAHSIYSCSTEEIKFKDTRVFQKSESTFNMTNPGTVDLVYKWNIIEERESIHSSFETLENNSEVLSTSTDETLPRTLTKDYEKHRKPFNIKPDYGIMKPGQSQDFTVQFTPKNVHDYRMNLICKIDNLDSEINPLTILLGGTSLPSFYHFDIPESTYSINHLPSLPEDIQILEFHAIGVGENYRKEFHLFNPTSQTYHFSWDENTLSNVKEISYFNCAFPRGIASTEKPTKMTFTFSAQEVGIFESPWTLLIREHEIKVPFLLVATVRMPRVTCCTAKVELEPTILGRIVESSIMITNNEDIVLAFEIDKSVGRKFQMLTVEPVSGILMPKKEQILKIIFKPRRVGDVHLSLQINVQKMKKPLNINIIGKVLEISSRVIYIDLEKRSKEIKSDTKNIIDLGTILLMKSRIIHFNITNMSEFPLNFQWDLGVTRNNATNGFRITMNETHGTVSEKNTLAVDLKILARKKIELKNYEIFLNIIGGVTYSLLLNASAMHPSIEFSFTEYNFGLCYITDTSAPYQITLGIKNRDDTMAIVECEFGNFPHLSVNDEEISRAIAPKGSASISIRFQPQEEKVYNESLKFFINSVMKQEVILRGQGIAYKINLVSPQDKFVDFGNVILGKMVKRRIYVLNSGKLPVQVEFILTGGSNDKIPNEGENIEKLVEIDPACLTILHPNKPQEVRIKFKPKRRMELFEEKIGTKVNSRVIPLSIIRGKCSAAEFHLNRSRIPFGKAVEGFSLNEKLVLHNTGDFGAKFKWSVYNIRPHFDITPLEGYSAPGTMTIFTAIYFPSKRLNRAETEATLQIEHQKSLTVFLCGELSRIPDPIDTINFQTSFRNRQTKYIEIANSLDIVEKVEALLTGEYFTSDDHLSSTIPPKSSISVGIIYSPLIMNSSDSGSFIVQLLHQKTIKVFNLRGSSTTPEPLGKILKEISAKTNHTELFSVYNWSKKPQHYYPKINAITFPKDNPIYKFNFVHDGIDIPAESMRHISATFHSYKEGTFHFNISFTNIEGEYQYYEVEYEVMKPEVLDTIEFLTTARFPLIQHLKIANPLSDQTVTYSVNSQHPDISIEGIPRILAPNSSDEINIKYHPMFPSESIEYLEVSCPQLGVFLYQLKLKAGTSPPEKVTNVSTTLGSQETFSISVTNSSKIPAEFTLTTDNSSFIINREKISIPGLEDIKIEVIFEPFSLEIISTNLTASSNTAGEIIYPIVGICSLPKSQGPFLLTPNEPLSIPFKNVFQDAKTFEYSVDPTISFSTGSSSNLISAKQTAKILVSFRDPNGLEADDDQNHVTGKLIVYCTDPTLSHINWVYYLKGVSTLKLN